MKIDLDELDRWVAAYKAAEASDRPMSATLPFIEQIKEKWGSSRDVLETLSSELRTLRTEVETARTRMLKVAEAIDEGQSLIECAAIVELECSLLPYEAREAVRQCIFATWTDEERARPPEKCPDCHDGGACLPGGCGVEGCERCGKPCPTCGGSCEVKTGRKTS